ncbi:thermonuclease family protein [Zooshikella harenae]|uniref:Thermonuclease family protein n=1 Tax=Zooshikella harenae TaxID=2827238 RepID=A0ABS5Z6A0_9GAMM|nr:thermonuclease family protein [Zooshikella harenae]MBU2709580.1 thermonuclease family protein [Zooshikella harenae]
MVCALHVKHNTNAQRFSEKALIISAFFVLTVFYLSSTFASTLPPSSFLSTTVSYQSTTQPSCNKPKGKQQLLHNPVVIDGDTLYADKQKIRLIGINTPEIGYDGQPPEPYALMAKKEAKHWLAEYSKHLVLITGKQQHDHYGRRLAYVVNQQGELLSEHLLFKGLGFYIAIPPNIELLSCFMAAEQQARNKKQNIWRDQSPISADRIRQSGFHLIYGPVTRVIITRNNWWVILADNNVALKIQQKDQPFFSVEWVKKLANTTIEVRGWLIDRRKKGRKLPKHYARWLMAVRHPAVIQLKKSSISVH